MAAEDRFAPVVVELQGSSGFEELTSRPAVGLAPAPPKAAGVMTGRLHGFGVDEQPVVSAIPGIPHEVISARTTVPLSIAQIGNQVVLVFENDDLRRPIILGVVQTAGQSRTGAESAVAIEADRERLLVSAEQEIVLRCGDASITLTRAGKVLINGKYVISSSSGYNKIKGAAVDIN